DLRRAELVSEYDQARDRLKAQAEKAEAEGSTDTRPMEAWDIIRRAEEAEKDKQEQTSGRVDRAKRDAEATIAQLQADKAAQLKRIQDMEAAAAKDRERKYIDGDGTSSDVPPLAPGTTGTPGPGRRKSPRGGG